MRCRRRGGEGAADCCACPIGFCGVEAVEAHARERRPAEFLARAVAVGLFEPLTLADRLAMRAAWLVEARWFGADKEQKARLTSEASSLREEVAARCLLETWPTRPGFVAPVHARRLAMVGWFRTHAPVELRIDYWPCEHARAFCAGIGEPELERDLPLKSSLWVAHDQIQEKRGYGGSFVHHMPTPEGGWLVGAALGRESMAAAVLAIVGGDVSRRIEGPEGGEGPAIVVCEHGTPYLGGVPLQPCDRCVEDDACKS